MSQELPTEYPYEISIGEIRVIVRGAADNGNQLFVELPNGTYATLIRNRQTPVVQVIDSFVLAEKIDFSCKDKGCRVCNKNTHKKSFGDPNYHGSIYDTSFKKLPMSKLSTNDSISLELSENIPKKVSFGASIQELFQNEFPCIQCGDIPSGIFFCRSCTWYIAEHHKNNPDNTYPWE